MIVILPRNRERKQKERRKYRQTKRSVNMEELKISPISGPSLSLEDEHFSKLCLFSDFTPVYDVNIILVPKSPCSTSYMMWQWEEGAPTAQSVRAPHSRLCHTHTALVCSCLLGCIHLASFSSLHGVPRLMKPCDDGTITLLIGIVLGAVWEQLGRCGCRCTHTHIDTLCVSLSLLEIHTIVVTSVYVSALFSSLPPT